MNILVFSASPNKKGNTHNLMEKFLEGLEGNKEIIEVYDKKIGACIDCKYCYKVENCAIKDDMIEIYDKIKKSDVIVIATPMYFSGVTAPLKALIDRLQVYWSKKYIRKDRTDIKPKRGVILATGGSSWPDMFRPVEETLIFAMAAMDAKVEEKIYVESTDKLPVKDNEKLLQEVYEKAAKFNDKKL